MAGTAGLVSRDEAQDRGRTEENMEKVKMSDLEVKMWEMYRGMAQVGSAQQEGKAAGMEQDVSGEEYTGENEKLFQERDFTEEKQFSERKDLGKEKRFTAEEVSGETGDGESPGEDEENGPEEDTDPDSLAVIEPLLDERIVRAVREMGFEKLTPIQVQAIPYLLEGEDIIGQAQTGTGKTAAFAIPALQKIDPELRSLQTIILCPTRELAMQAADEIRSIAKYMHGIKVLPVYGGQEIRRQINGLKGTQIIVGTPGRVMDHMRRHTIKLDHVNMVVLDEADEMLDMGFREDMELILGEIPGEHQTALFSATMPKPILDIADRFQKNARLVRVAAKELTIPLVSQRYYKVKSQDKDAACVRLLEYYQPKLCLIFCNTKIKVDELAEVLKKAGFLAEGLHGDMSQHLRDVAMGRFRNGSANILIATDVAARGIDVDNVEVVINYDLPQDNEYYVHRIGRTGRAGRTGRSFTFVSGKEIFRIRQIERFCKTTIEEKKLPGASKVLKAKADKYLSRAWELHEHEDIELMKSYIQRKLDSEECDIMDLAAAMLKMEIGDRGPEIAVDDYEARSSRSGDKRGRDGRDSRRRRGRDEGREDRRRSRRDEGGEGRRRRRREEERDPRREREGDGFRDSRRRDAEEGRRRSREEERDFRREQGDGFRDSRWKEEEKTGYGSGEERGRRRYEQENDRDSRRRRETGETRDSRRKREKEEKRKKRGREEARSARVWDVRMDGSDKGLAFSFPKKKKKK